MLAVTNGTSKRKELLTELTTEVLSTISSIGIKFSMFDTFET